ncbi:hypothetical protein DSM03_11812 [Leeuwenhoekiella aestuarii]|uniref:DUF3108 domain-containing protein n=1 Tax=Leeuwenhoekiella aestuarii TaxID=2249426 RepID=A0A4V1KNS1_9FLAO|nr:hypothetical protein [Leeuwenhoekiella aestuarii]RXG11344.1 hypothetical protein DSM03_11812 [Leeuwenhoekiella aestuarii]RXG11767.1 hypothetical protein DSM04_10993 [Leeuwenhoekiella aestuarii]
MKTLLSHCFLIFGINGILSQSLCSDLKTLNDFTSLEFTSYGTANNLIAVTEYEVSSAFATQNGNRIILKAVLPEDDSISNTKQTYYEVECNSSVLRVSHKNVIPAFVFEEYSNMEVDASNSSISIPVNPEMGQKLEDISFSIEILVAPITHKVRYFLTDRSIKSQERINTPAGTFECFVIEANSKMKPKNKNTGTVKQWFAPQIGLIKQVDFDASGKVTSVNLLTALNSGNQQTKIAIEGE